MSIKRNKKVTIKLAISQEELDGLIDVICDNISGNIEDIERLGEYFVNNVTATRLINKHDQKMYGLSINIRNNGVFLDLESNIVCGIVQQHIDSYNQSIEQEKQIRQDQRDGY